MLFSVLFTTPFPLSHFFSRFLFEYDIHSCDRQAAGDRRAHSKTYCLFFLEARIAYDPFLFFMNPILLLLSFIIEFARRNQARALVRRYIALSELFLRFSFFSLLAPPFTLIFLPFALLSDPPFLPSSPLTGISSTTGKQAFPGLP